MLLRVLPAWVRCSFGERSWQAWQAVPTGLLSRDSRLPAGFLKHPFIQRIQMKKQWLLPLFLSFFSFFFFYFLFLFLSFFLSFFSSISSSSLSILLFFSYTQSACPGRDKDALNPRVLCWPPSPLRSPLYVCVFVNTWMTCKYSCLLCQSILIWCSKMLYAHWPTGKAYLLLHNQSLENCAWNMPNIVVGRIITFRHHKGIVKWIMNNITVFRTAMYNQAMFLCVCWLVSVHRQIDKA